MPVRARGFLAAKAQGRDVGKAVLIHRSTAELGRFAVTGSFDDLGAFKTPSLRKVAVTAPFMHDGSTNSLRDVVKQHSNGVSLREEEMSALVAFMESLTSPQFATQSTASGLP